MPNELPELRTISCFTGSAMLDNAVELVFRRLGYGMRTIAYIECNQYCVEQLLPGRIRDRLIGNAPLWRDVRTFPAASVAADAVIGGFPCQDLSVAGRGAGLAVATRSGLFFELLRVTVDSGAGLLLMENVPGLYTTASPVGDGEYSAAGIVVVQALAAAGFRCKWLSLAAEDVGAPHGRARWWCVAWRPVGDSECAGFDGSALRGRHGAADERAACREDDAVEPARAGCDG